MKSKKLILALTMTLVMGLGVTTYASTEPTTNTTNNSSNSIHHKSELRRITGMRGSDYVKSILINRLNMTDKEIMDGINSGKSMYDLAKEKGMTEDQFKAALLEEKNKAIDKAVTDGKITKEQSDSIKEAIKNKMNNHTGVPGENGHNCEKGNGHMSGDGSNGSGN